MIEIENVIDELKRERPIFHSEADFQHALAWKVHEIYPDSKVRLEFCTSQSGKKEYVDIYVKHSNEIYLIELKYKTRKLDVVYYDEEFHLLNQGAQDIGRYDFIKDIGRTERFISSRSNTVGYAIFLTNDENYWRESNRSTVDSHFRIHPNRTLAGELIWGQGTGKGTMKGRESPLLLSRSHQIQWLNYSELAGPGPNKFRYILIRI
jgi:hypothetical protein